MVVGSSKQSAHSRGLGHSDFGSPYGKEKMVLLILYPPSLGEATPT